MIISSTKFDSSVRGLKSKVELYNGSTLTNTCTCNDVLKDFTLTRTGDNSKFFGFGVCQKLTLSLVDIYRELDVTDSHTAQVWFGDGTTFECPYPTFYVSEANRDEKTNTLTCTAYDRLYEASKLTLADLGTRTVYSYRTLAVAIAERLGTALKVVSGDDSWDELLDTANLEGTESLRDILDDIAECTQSIYFINYENLLTFRCLNVNGEADFTIDRNMYYELETGTAKVLKAICNATELGDNVTAEKTVDGEPIEGETQYLRSNAFWELREDIGDLLNGAIAKIGGMSASQFKCSWCGHYRLELGDKLKIATETGEYVTSYLFSDITTYDGALSEITDWTYTENNTETHSNPSTIGEKLTQTYARVDKVNKRVDIMVSDIAETKENVASLTLTTDSINLKVLEHEEKIEAFEELETGQVVDRLAEVEIELDGISATVSENTTKVENIEAENKKINDELTTLKAADTALDERLKSNTTRISGVEVDLEGVKTTVSNQNTRISDLQSADETIKGSIQLNSNAIGQLEVKTDNITASVTQANDKITTLTNTTNGLKTTTEEHTEQIGAIETSLDGINLTVSNQSSKITTLETTTSNQGTAIEDLTEDVETNTSSIDTLTTTTETHTNQISALRVRADEIAATVTNVSEVLTSSTDNIEQQIDSLTKEVSAKMSAEDVTITVRSELENGVDHVTTQTGFTFNETGLTVEKAGKEMKTQITEDGMTVYRDTTPVLTANNAGVDATNLRASTYIIIGNNSRFENFGNSRTACFWIGGND